MEDSSKQIFQRNRLSRQGLRRASHMYSYSVANISRENRNYSTKRVRKGNREIDKFERVFTKPLKDNLGDSGYGPESCVDEEDIGSEIHDINLTGFVEEDTREDNDTRSICTYSSESEYDSGAFSRPSTPETATCFNPSSTSSPLPW